MSARFSGAGALCLALLVGAAAIGEGHRSVERGDPSGPPAAADGSDGVTWLELTVQFAGEEPVRLVSPAGKLVTYRSFRHQDGFGLVASLDEETGQVAVQLVGLAGEALDRLAARQLGRLEGNLGFELVGVTPGAGLSLGVRVDRADASVREMAGSGCSVRASSGTVAVPGGGDDEGDSILNASTCCVTCNGGEWCACEVVLRCGSCSGC